RAHEAGPAEGRRRPGHRGDLVHRGRLRGGEAPRHHAVRRASGPAARAAGGRAVSEGVTTVVGIDPGLVHTGIVALSFYPGLKQVEVRSAVIAGDQPGEHVQGALEFLEDHVPDRDHVFVEDYRERGQSYSTSPKMRELMSELMR